MRRDSWVWLRPLGGAAILGVLVWRLGTGPFIDAVRRVDGWSLAATAAIALVTTGCCAWRWTLVAEGMGVAVSRRSAFAACYRSQFLNVTVPGGVLGDVHRGVRHGRDVGDTSRALRSVVWERFAGQLVLVAVAVPVLLLLPSPVREAMPRVTTAAVTGLLLVVALLVLSRARRSRPVLTGALATAAADVRAGLLARHTWPRIAAASALAVAGHVLTFLIAARTAGSTATSGQLLPLALLVLLAMGVPANVAGWGPREGMAAWVFGAAGLGANEGAVTAVVYGLMVFVASLPGAVLVLTARRRRPGSPASRGAAPLWPAPATAGAEGAAGA
jgi:glycosyltransferase 2 family protein